MSSTTNIWYKDLGKQMIEYIYDGEYYHVLKNDGIIMTKEKPKRGETNTEKEFLPLTFWFQ